MILAEKIRKYFLLFYLFKEIVFFRVLSKPCLTQDEFACLSVNALLSATGLGPLMGFAHRRGRSQSPQEAIQPVSGGQRWLVVITAVVLDQSPESSSTNT